MKRAFQYRLVTLLCAIAFCAFTVYFFLPFSPNIVFLSPEMAFSSDSNGTGYPEVSVTLRNNGRYPVWYHGCSGVIAEFSIEGDLSKGERHVQSLDRQQIDWICLPPGKTAILPIPAYMLFNAAKIEVEFRDWRRRVAICASQEFDFSSVPVNGVPGKGVQPPATIPQHNKVSGKMEIGTESSDNK